MKSHEVVEGTGQLWSGSSLLATVYYVLVSSDQTDEAPLDGEPVAIGILRFGEADTEVADTAYHERVVELELADGRCFPCRVKQPLRGTPQRWMVMLSKREAAEEA